MASAQLAGRYNIYIENPGGKRVLVYSASSYWWGPGGSSDGTIANTPEKWNYLPLCPVKGYGGCKIILTYYGAAGTTDASDGAMQIPVVIDGVPAILGNSAHATGIMSDKFDVTLAAADEAYLANRETNYLVYTAKAGVKFQVGGNRVFVSIENNA